MKMRLVWEWLVCASLAFIFSRYAITHSMFLSFISVSLVVVISQLLEAKFQLISKLTGTLRPYALWIILTKNI